MMTVPGFDIRPNNPIIGLSPAEVLEKESQGPLRQDEKE